MSGSSYVMSCLQCEISVIQDPADKDPLLKKNLKRSLELAAYAVATEESRLLILPEGWLQGFVPKKRCLAGSIFQYGFHRRAVRQS
jgi:predicted amidohydrolase